MTEIITYRLSSAGAWGYEFYDAGRNRIGSVSTSVISSSPALINGEGIDWYSTFSMEQTIVPGYWTFGPLSVIIFKYWESFR